MVRNIDRVLAEQDIRRLTVAMSAQHGDSAKEALGEFQRERGEVVRFREDRDGQFEREKMHALMRKIRTVKTATLDIGMSANSTQE